MTKPSLQRILTLLLLALLLAASSSGTARAQDPTPTDDEVNRIAKQLYCPVCESTPLDVCPTQACRQWRELIRQQLAEGWTEDQIKQYFVKYYGARVLSEPPRSGLNWLAYLLPPIVILGGAAFLFRSMRTWTRRGPKTESRAPRRSSTRSAGPKNDEYVARMEEELRRRK